MSFAEEVTSVHVSCNESGTPENVISGFSYSQISLILTVVLGFLYSVYL